MTLALGSLNGVSPACARWANSRFTTTLTRAMVQESAKPEFRGRILSVLTLGMMGSAPLGAILLGFLIERFGTLQALLPSVAMSLLIFLVGTATTGIWRYRSPAADV